MYRPERLVGHDELQPYRYQGVIQRGAADMGDSSFGADHYSFHACDSDDWLFQHSIQRHRIRDQELLVGIRYRPRYFTSYAILVQLLQWHPERPHHFQELESDDGGPQQALVGAS